MRAFKLFGDSQQPTRATVDSAGYDLRASEDVVIETIFDSGLYLGGAKEPLTLSYHAGVMKDLGFKATLVPTGVAIELEEGDYADLRSRSGVSSKNLLIMPNGMGLIDKDFFPNEIKVPLINLSPFPIIIKKGERIAQLVLNSYNTLTNEEEVLNERLAGFNSTGTE